MGWSTLFLLAFGPAVFWLWFFYKKDALEPEPKWLIVRTFFLGMFAVAPASLLEEMAVLAYGSSYIFLAVLVAPVVEELAKYFSVRWSVYRHREFDEPMDGIVYASAAALGFASFENLNYVVMTHIASSETPGSPVAPVLGISLMRAVFSVPAHVMFSAMWGYALGAAKFAEDGRLARNFVRAGLFFAIAMHAVFNLVAGFPLGILLLAVFMVWAWRLVRKRITLALLNSPFLEAANRS